MADQGLLGQSKPAATTNTVLYAAPVDAVASAVLTIANDGTASDYDLAIKDYDQKLTVDASTYKLHEGDIITGYRFKTSTSIPQTAALSNGTNLTSDDGEKKVVFESFYIPPYTEIDVQNVAIRQLSLTSVVGTIAVGETLVKGTSPNTATVTVYAVTEGSGTTTVQVGPSTLAGTGTELADGDSLTASGGATGTIDTGGVGTAENDFVFSTDGGTTYDLFSGTQLTVFADRAYRFDLSDSSMSGRDFKLSETVNGEWGPDGDFTETDDNGTEYTTGKTSNGTAGSAGAYVQYDFSANANLPSNLYYYDGGTGTASNNVYGGSDRLLTSSTTYTYDEFYAYNIEGTWVNSSDSFTYNGTSYVVSAQTSGPYGYVRSYDSTTLKVIKGLNSADFAGTNTFQDAPLGSSVDRSEVTVSSVDVATTAVENENYLAKDVNNTAGNVEKITSLVVGPGERLIVESNTQNNVFSFIGFEDTSTAFTTRNYTVAAAGVGGSGA